MQHQEAAYYPRSDKPYFKARVFTSAPPARVVHHLSVIAYYRLIYQDDLAPTIAISEAVGIARDYGTDDSYRFINGMLDSIRRTLEKTA
ncbi:MAG: hypothetical protein LBD79_05580 [Treponema sp.]|nr:hypothetical protein [Treponema sp.]